MRARICEGEFGSRTISGDMAAGSEARTRILGLIKSIEDTTDKWFADNVAKLKQAYQRDKVYIDQLVANVDAAADDAARARAEI